MAEYHFRRSLLINQRSSVLRCYVGVALHKIGRAADALEQLQVDPTSCLRCAQTASVSIAKLCVRCMCARVLSLLLDAADALDEVQMQPPKCVGACGAASGVYVPDHRAMHLFAHSYG